jgi:HlyD family type I secretion membrane fusion protein
LFGQIAGVEAEFDIQRTQLQRYQEASSSNAISLNRREELQRENLRLEAAISQLEGETRIQSAQLDQLDQREEELVAQYRREAALRLEEQLTERAALTQTRDQLEARLERTVIRVAVTGVVNGLSVQNLGEVVAAGEVLAEIVPAGARNFAEIEIAADRIGGVSVGSEASLKILTFDFTRYGDITARVERISPSSFQKENGDSVFRVRLGFDNAASRSGGPRHEVSPGMTVVADIKSERRTILSYLLKPVRVIADRALTEA